MSILILSYVAATSKQQLDDNFLATMAKILFCKFFELKSQLERLFWCSKEYWIGLEGDWVKGRSRANGFASHDLEGTRGNGEFPEKCNASRSHGESHCACLNPL